MTRERDKTPQSATGPTPAATAAHGAMEHTARLHALVISERMIATYPLPDNGSVTIGRAASCEILIDDASISRQHAELTLGTPLVIRDLGSANGTRVRDQILPANEPVEITPGEAIQVGFATLIVQRQVAAMRPRRLWTHDYFEVRVEEECARAARSGSTFVVMRLSAVPPVPRDLLQQAITGLVRMSDVVGEYGPTDYEVLLVDTSAEEADQARDRFLSELSKQGINVRVGIARYIVDGRTPDELMSRAESSARGHDLTPSVRPETVAERTMRDLYAIAARVAHGTITVLILGETGVGKEVLAEKVHNLSPRAKKPYLRLNCAALSESLLESELFGHERGAFTGAIAAKAGLLETADGGTVFLDEVGELPLSMQVKLLRVIEERVVLRVGGLKPKPLDVRFIAATNRDLEGEIEKGTFRQDLFFRLNGATLVIPPLRERPAEIPGLARAFLDTAAKQANLTKPPELSAEALQSLCRYTWPGNIRELRNTIERAVLLCGDGRIETRHLPLEKMRVTLSSVPVSNRDPPAPPAPHAAAKPRSGRTKSPSRPLAPAVLRRGRRLSPEEERAEIEHALQECGGNQTRAAQMLGIGRRTLINRIAEFGLSRPRGR